MCNGLTDPNFKDLDHKMMKSYKNFLCHQQKTIFQLPSNYQQYY